LVEELAGATRHDDDQDAASMALHFLNVRTSDQRATARNWIVLGATSPMTPAQLEAAVDRTLAKKPAIEDHDPLTPFGGRGWWSPR
jgi:hypothetical protein